MAIAYYPTRVRAFNQHRNLLDDVDADDINAIQNELTAVMQIVGPNPQIYNDIQTDFTDVTGTGGDTGGTVDDDSVIFSTVLRYYDPKLKPFDHGTVAARMDDMERGGQRHCFSLRASQLDIASSATGLAQRPKGIRFPKPSTDADPFDLYNGLGVTIRKAGFWVFSGSVVYALQGSAAGSNDGIYQATVDYDNNFVEGIERQKVSGANTHPAANPLLMGFFTRGMRVSLRASQDSGRTQKIRLARLAGVCLRETTG